MKVSDKVIRVGSNDGEPNVTDWNGSCPEFGKVYVVSDVWDTRIGPQMMLVGFGPAPYIHGFKTGWLCKYFRLLEEVQAENRSKMKQVI